MPESTEIEVQNTEAKEPVAVEEEEVCELCGGTGIIELDEDCDGRMYRGSGGKICSCQFDFNNDD